MSKRIRIMVEGTTGSGKTAISEVIVRALSDAGFDVAYTDQDGTYRTEEQNALAIDSLQQHGLELIVEQHQRVRKGY